MKSANRKHDRQYFYKYMSYETAKIVLANSTLRWSSPLIFNDPFDVPREVLPDVTDVKIGRALARKIINELTHPSPNYSDFNHRLQPLFAFFRTMFPNGLPLELLENFQQLVESPPMGENTGLSIQEFKEVWRTMLKGRRILCLSTNPFITSMWFAYADNYRGVVLRFECSDKLDSAWLLARPIIYSDDTPLTYTAEGTANLLWMKDEDAIRYISHDVTFIKTKNWAPEEEWRLSSYRPEDGDKLYSDLGFHQKELSAVIMGPSFDSDKIDELKSLMNNYPDAGLLSAKITDHRSIIIE